VGACILHYLLIKMLISWKINTHARAQTVYHHYGIFVLFVFQLVVYFPYRVKLLI